MKLYFRLLQYAKPIEKFAIPYFLITIVSIIFGLVNFGLIVPILNVLFLEDTSKIVADAKDIPEFSFSFTYALDLFNYYFYGILVKYGKMEALQFTMVLLVISVLLANAFRYWSSRIQEAFRIHTLLRIRQEVFNKVINLHLGYFSNERKGALMGKITSDVEVVQGSITNTITVFFKEPITLIGYFAVLFYMSYQLTFFTILVLPVSGYIIGQLVRKIRVQAVNAQDSLGQLISILDEALGGLRVIKAFNAITYTQDKFYQENVKYTNILKSIARRQELAAPVSEFLGVLLVAGIVIYGGSLVFAQSSTLSANEFIAYIAIFSQATRPIKALSGSYTAIQHGLASGKRILELIDTENIIKDKPNAYKLNGFEREIEFKNVSFSYETTEVLNKVSFTIEKGKTVALVGPSGGGKSTISDLIPRFYDPKEGAILIDGHDLRDCQLESVRGLMGIVSQESILFNDTIFNNIAFGNPSASKEAVINAAKVANAHKFIMETEKGYDSYIGDRGVKLSGGQKQRISIARAVLKNPPIMILDEATSALDTESEKLVQEALTKLMEHRTSLVIAHRLSTIKNADLILVIQNGEIVERGTHDLLMQITDGLYRKLQEMQSVEATAPPEF